MKHKDGALAGLKVIDLSRVLAGPLCTQILGDHGAEVIKIEPPSGDETRTWGPIGPNGSAYYSGINRNKRHAAVDLTKERGRDILLKLLENADVLVHNFKAGTLERWGLGYDNVLQARFPKLIYCHITGFGEEGPLGGLPGYDSVVQAIAGCMSVNGRPESGPTRVGMSIVDIGTAMNALTAILMAAYERQHSGLGQKIDVCLYDTALSYLHPHAAGYLQTGLEPKRTGNQHPSIAPYEEFQTKTGPMFLGVGNDRQFILACKMLNCPELATDERFTSNALRVTNRQILHDLLQLRLVDQDAEALSLELLRSGIPASAILDVPKVLASAHTTSRAMIVEDGDYKALGIPIKLSRTPGTVRLLPQPLGENTRDICREAGLSDAEIEKLLADHIAVAPTTKDGG
jgi:crotonobetainyl-CoA:carnitine CoA-transferase CaiB-like acyl-CoA transferase